MAFGFIKKIFSFGKNEVEEATVAEAPQLPAPAAPETLAPAPSPAEAPVAPVPEPSAPDLPAAPDAVPARPAEVPPAPAPEPSAPDFPAEVPDETPAPAVPEIPEPAAPEILPGEPAAPQESPAEPDAVPPPEPEIAVAVPVAPEPEPAPAEGPPVAATAPSRVTVAKAVETKIEAAPAPAPAPQPRTPWFQRLTQGLSRSSRELKDSISGVFTRRKLDDDTLQDLEDVLIRADLGMETAIRVTDALASGRYGKDISDDEVRTVMAAEIEKVLTPVALPLELDLSHKPHVVLVVGVNGTGKTTTIGKLAAKLTAGGLKVTLAAGDTFRAAAIEQLKIWGERTGSQVVASRLGADAAGLAFDAYEKAKEAGSDVLIIDTAGRLQNRTELMAELEKIVRVLGKHDPEAPHTVLQTIDATTGQNALGQVEIFRNVAGVNGLVMTKLDGTARGGILVAIAAKHKLPVYFIGVGEQIDDLEPFAAKDFAKAIAGVN